MDKKLQEMIARANQAQATPLAQQEGHGPALTRRALLGRGIIGFSTSFVAPSFLSLISRQAMGLECSQEESTTRTVPYLHIEASGGMNMAGSEFIFGKQGAGAPLELLSVGSYSSLGLTTANDPSVTGMINREFGAPFHAHSAILAGLKSVMSPAAIAKTGVAGGAGRSADDTRQNLHNPIQLAIKSVSSKGELVQIAGTTGSNTGGQTAATDVAEDPSLSKAQIRSTNDIAGLINPGVLATRLSEPAARKIFAAANKMSDVSLAKFNSKDLPSQVADLIRCGYVGGQELVEGFTPANILPQNDTDVQAILGIAAGAALPQAEAAAFSIATLLVKGHAAGGTIEMGGYDYHNNARQSTDDRNFAIGRRIGFALELAHRKNQPLFVALTSDGSVSANGQTAQNSTLTFRDANGVPTTVTQSKFQFSSDSGGRGAYLMFAIGTNESGRPEMRHNQIGAFGDDGSVNATQGVQANSDRLQALNIVANYASLNDKMGQFNEVLRAAGAQNPFAGDERAYVAFTPLKTRA